MKVFRKRSDGSARSVRPAEFFGALALSLALTATVFAAERVRIGYSRLMLEVASRLVERSRDFPYLQAKISLREQGADQWPLTLFASDSPATIHEVEAGEVQFAIINPGMMLKLAALGSAPFNAPIALRIIAILPSHDQMIFAVRKETGLTSFADIRARKFPLKLSLRAQKDHALHVITDHVFQAAGVTFDDIVSWGGQVRYDAGMAYGDNRIGAYRRGAIDAIFAEGATAWGNMALELGMKFLSLDDVMLRQLENVGLRRGTLQRRYYPKLAADIPTIDFSGWPIYTRADTPDSWVTDFCRALDASKANIPWGKDEPLPLAQMVRDSDEGHLEVPLHPAAERYWRAAGYL